MKELLIELGREKIIEIIHTHLLGSMWTSTSEINWLRRIYEDLSLYQLCDEYDKIKEHEFRFFQSHPKATQEEELNALPFIIIMLHGKAMVDQRYSKIAELETEISIIQNKCRHKYNQKAMYWFQCDYCKHELAFH